jgi:uncharacterized protein YbgA (DUF1722 family)
LSRYRRVLYSLSNAVKDSASTGVLIHSNTVVSSKINKRNKTTV